MNTKAYQITALVLLVLMLALSGFAVVGIQEMAGNGWPNGGPYGALYDGDAEIAGRKWPNGWARPGAVYEIAGNKWPND